MKQPAHSSRPPDAWYNNIPEADGFFSTRRPHHSGLIRERRLPSGAVLKYSSYRSVMYEDDARTHHRVGVIAELWVNGVLAGWADGLVFHGFKRHSVMDIFSWLDMMTSDLGAAAEELGRVPAWLKRVRATGSFFYLDHLEVLPAFQGNGLGREFCRDLLTLMLGRFRATSFMFRVHPMQYARSGKPRQVPVNYSMVERAVTKLGLRYLSWLPGVDCHRETRFRLWAFGHHVLPLPVDHQAWYGVLKRRLTISTERKKRSMRGY